MGKEGQTVPLMTDEFIQTISDRYIELFEKITGETFQKQTVSEEEIPRIVDQIIEGL